MTPFEQRRHRETSEADGNLSLTQVGAGAIHRQLDWLRPSPTLLHTPPDPRVVHDMRVATRRCRAALREFRSLVDPERTAAVLSELGWVDTLLGEARDWDILIGRTRKWVDRAAPTDEQRSGRAIRRGLEVLDERRTRALGLLVDGLGSARYADLVHTLDSIVGALERREGNDPAGALDVAHKRIRRARRRLRASLHGDVSKLGAADLHRVRILLRRLRYVIEFYQGLLPSDIVDPLSELIAAQDDLGAAQDAGTSERLLRSVRTSSRSEGVVDAELDLAFEVLIKRERRRGRKARARVERTWSRLPKTLKHLRAVLGSPAG